MSNRHTLIAGIVSTLILASNASAATLTVQHSGYLLGAADAPVETGTGPGVALGFALFHAPSGGTAAWTGACTVPVHSGYYAVSLGDGTCGSPIADTELAPDSPAWLQVTVGAVTLAPRTHLTVAPAAVTAANALALEGLALADLDMRYAKLDGPAAAVGQVLQWNGTGWQAADDADSGGTVQSIEAGTGLSGGTITTTGSLAVDVGTGAGQIPQLDSSGLIPDVVLPPIAGSLLVDGTVSAAKLGASGATAGQVLVFDGTHWGPGASASGDLARLNANLALLALQTAGTTPTSLVDGWADTLASTVGLSGTSTNYVAGSGFAETPPRFSAGGTGTDGSLTLAADLDLNRQARAPSRTFPDGVAYRVGGLSGRVVTLSNGAANTNGLVAGDEVMLVDVQGTAADQRDVGNYEFFTLASVGSSGGNGTLTLASDPARTYGGTTGFGTNVVFVQRVPQYQDLSLGNFLVTASAFDGAANHTDLGTNGCQYTGIVALRVRGTLTLGTTGGIDVSQKGFRGGVAGSSGLEYAGGRFTGHGGDGTAGVAANARNTNGQGGDGGHCNVASPAAIALGGRSFSTDGAGGTTSGGIAGGAGGGAGSGGGGTTFGRGGDGWEGGGGASGANNGDQSNGGGGGGGCPYKLDVTELSTVTTATFDRIGYGSGSAAGGGGGGSGADADIFYALPGGAGLGGTASGVGGNGGTSAQPPRQGTRGADGGNGTAGGGIVYVAADTIVLPGVANRVRADGGTGGAGGDGRGGPFGGSSGGGAGAQGATGGSIRVIASSITGASTGVVSARGGNGGKGGNGSGNASVAGGTGGTFSTGNDKGSGGAANLGSNGQGGYGGAGGGGNAGYAGRVHLAYASLNGSAYVNGAEASSTSTPSPVGTTGVTNGLAPMVLTSTAQAPRVPATQVTLVAQVEAIDAFTLNTDLTAAVLVASGATSVPVTLVDQGSSGAIKVYVGTAALGSPGATTLQWQLSTHNGKRVRVHGVTMNWQ